MLFNSSIFVFLFLPVTYGLFLLLKRYGYGRGAMALLATASLIFYGWWDIKYVALLLASILFNFAIGQRLTRKGSHKGLLILGIAGNLGALAYYKYAGFFMETAESLFHSGLSIPEIILPLGISFFTFQQIAYLVDAHKGEADEHDLLEYTVFVTFFPQLIAGPIVHHKRMMPQFHAHTVSDYDWEKAAMGLTVFAIGLFKKVVIADSLAATASPLFHMADTHDAVSFTQGWLAALSYSLQLYFDFSGYSNMAFGLALLFGIRLPANFLSPYKAKSIIEFWQKWHITLSHFLRDYLYIPLGGNRKGRVRKYINLMITMLLGGLWHGAGWTFVLWGGLHGLYLCINHAWRYLFPVKGERFILRDIAGWITTFLAVTVAWVLFRAPDMDAALRIYEAIAGLSNKAVVSINWDAWAMILGGLLLVRFTPNALDMIAFDEERERVKRWYSWEPNLVWTGFTVSLLAISLYMIVYNTHRISEFIYFQF